MSTDFLKAFNITFLNIFGVQTVNSGENIIAFAKAKRGIKKVFIMVQ